MRTAIQGALASAAALAVACVVHSPAVLASSPTAAGEGAAAEVAAAGARAFVAASSFRDSAGRPIRIVMRTRRAAASTYASILRGTVHGWEISRLTVLVVSRGAVSRLCGQSALGCYSGSHRTMIVPAGEERSVAPVVYHEYGHHLDLHRRGSGGELNGGRHWWRVRRMGKWVRAGVYSRAADAPWERRVGEMFAEDYAALHLDNGMCYEPIGCVTTRVRRAVLGDVYGHRPHVRPVRIETRTVDLVADESVEFALRARRTGGRLHARVTTDPASPGEMFGCVLVLRRDGRIIDYRSDLGTVEIVRPDAVGGRYELSIEGMGDGCRGELELREP